MIEIKDNMDMGTTLSFDKKKYGNEEYFYIRITNDIDIMEDEKCLGYCLTKQQSLLLANNLMKFANNIK